MYIKVPRHIVITTGYEGGILRIFDKTYVLGA